MGLAKLLTQKMKQHKCLLVLVVLGLLVALYKADTSTSFFGKDQEDVCMGENCEKVGEMERDDVDKTGGDEDNGDRANVAESEVEALVKDEPAKEAEENEPEDLDKDKVNDRDEDEESKMQDETAEDKESQATSTATSTEPEEINVIITFTNAETNSKLQRKFELTVSSMLGHATVPLAVHIIGDPASQKIAAQIINRVDSKTDVKHRIVELDVDELAKELHKIVKPMQDHFSAKPGAYYSHSLFFLSIALHQVMPESMHKVIMLDADLKFMDDIKKLYDRFRLFSKENIIGIGHEMQPVYRHAFWKYRQENPGTRVGDPGPKGLPGFNSGVLLLNLDNLRRSKLYNSLITVENVEKLTEEFHFKGHLGDQDFFTLLAMKYEWLFHVLPCSWNRQLCTWWREHGYKDVWDLYHTCDMDVKIYHGNCDTNIPY